MTTEELLAARIRQLRKRPEDLERAATTLMRNRLRSKAQFEKRYHTRLTRDWYEPGTLVLIRNTAVEKEMDRKAKPRYLGPYQVARRTRNGAYILQELDGTLLRQRIAAFRVIPYISRRQLPHMLHAQDAMDDEDSSDEEPVSD